MSHQHLGGPHLTQNQGNVLGDRPCVRQSRLYREHVGGNAMKDLMGHGELKWDVTKTEGAYAGGRAHGVAAEAKRDAGPSIATRDFARERGGSRDEEPPHHAYAHPAPTAGRGAVAPPPASFPHIARGAPAPMHYDDDEGYGYDEAPAPVTHHHHHPAHHAHAGGGARAGGSDFLAHPAPAREAVSPSAAAGRGKFAPVGGAHFAPIGGHASHAPFASAARAGGIHDVPAPSGGIGAYPTGEVSPSSRTGGRAAVVGRSSGLGVGSAPLPSAVAAPSAHRRGAGSANRQTYNILTGE